MSIRAHTAYVSIREHTCAAMRIRLEDALLEVGHVLGLFQDPINVGLSNSRRVKAFQASARVSSVSITACLYVGFISFFNITLSPELKYETPRNASLRSGE